MSPAALESLTANNIFNYTLPFGKFESCLPQLKTTNCSTKPGFNLVPNSDWQQTEIRPNGTATAFSNMPGSLTAPPYGSSTVWTFFSGAVPSTAVAVTNKGVAGTGTKTGGALASATGSAGAKSSAGMLMISWRLVAAVVGFHLLFAGWYW